jgi:2',5'-phosphodiesterase
MEGDDWIPDLATPLKSAYFTKYGKEPDFTNYAKVKEDPIFIDTLDYLFYSSSSSSSSSVEKEGGGGSIEVKDVLALPNRETVPGPLPNDEEPSDHLLMAADFTIVGGSNNSNNNSTSNSSGNNYENNIIGNTVKKE